MIINNSLNDKTQLNILEHLKDTERLLEMASGSKVEITVMSDACPAHNVSRMLDGHFTGTVTKIIDPKEAFIPVGTTVNVCGTVIYKLLHEISISEFKSRLYSTLKSTNKPYRWDNYNRGNHFVSLSYSDGTNMLEKGQYMIVHASANEYRNQLYHNKGTKYFPHGLGLEIHDGDIHYTDDGGICVGTKTLYSKDSLSIGVDAFIRSDRTPLDTCIDKIIEKNPATIVAELKQLASFSARGFEIWNEQ